MKTHLILILIGGISLIGQIANAGAINSGGGRGFLCTNSNVKLLDLFEASTVYNFKLEESLNDFQSELRRTDAKLLALENKNVSTGKTYLDSILKNIHFLPRGTKLKLVDDSFEQIKPDGCETVQIAFWADDSTILVDHDLWDKMNSQDQVALLVHELVYSYFRLGGYQDSIVARRFVSFLFSVGTLPPKTITLKPSLRCISADSKYDFYVFQSNSLNGEQTIISFNVLAGLPIFSKVIANLGNAPLSTFISENHVSSFSAVTPIISDFLGHSAQIKIAIPGNSTVLTIQASGVRGIDDGVSNVTCNMNAQSY